MKIPKNRLVWFRIIIGATLLFMGAGMAMQSAVLVEKIESFASTSPVDWYGDFLKHGVVPNADFFVSLCVWGGILSGISLILGIGTIIGSLVAMFMFLNYGLAAAGTMFIVLPGTLILIIFLLMVAFSLRSKEFSLDQRIAAKIPLLKPFLL